MTKKIDWVEIAERKTTGEFITVIDRDAKMTNREWLFAMSNRELAEFILCPMIKPEIAPLNVETLRGMSRQDEMHRGEAVSGCVCRMA